MSSTSFSPESPNQRTARLAAQALKQIKHFDTSVDWTKTSAQIIIDCIKWLANGSETNNTTRDPKGVRFIHLNERQSDVLWLCRYEAIWDDYL